MNTRQTAILYLVSVVAAFIAGSYLTRQVEAVKDGNGEHVNAIVRDIAAKLSAPDPGQFGFGSRSPTSTTLMRPPGGSIDLEPGPDQPIGRSTSVDRPGKALGEDVKQPKHRAPADDGGYFDDERIREQVEGLIEQLEPWQLEYVILSTTGMSADQLSDIADLPSYAVRLAAVTMDGVITESSPVVDTPSEIDFTRNINNYYQGKSGETVFDSSAGRIYAVFPTDGYQGDSVLMKWYRTDKPGGVHVKTHPILQGAPYNYVWAEFEQWREASYQVEIYSTRETLDQLASGDYEVFDAHRQTQATENDSSEDSN